MFTFDRLTPHAELWAFIMGPEPRLARSQQKSGEKTFCKIWLQQNWINISASILGWWWIWDHFCWSGLVKLWKKHTHKPNLFWSRPAMQTWTPRKHSVNHSLSAPFWHFVWKLILGQTVPTQGITASHPYIAGGYVPISNTGRPNWNWFH